jgi:hypothetical protein
MKAVPQDASSLAANAAACGVAIDPARLPMIEGGVAAVSSALSLSPIAVAFETEPSAFIAMLDRHAWQPDGNR